MKPIKARTFFVQNLLIALSICFAIFGLILSSKSLIFSDAAWGYLSQGDVKHPIILGIIPVLSLATFLSYLFIYLNFEFYGIKSAIYSTVSLCAIMALGFILLKIFPSYTLSPLKNPNDEVILQFLTIPDKIIIATISAIAAGFTVAFIVAASMKKLTRNYFMFFRFPIASLAGFILIAIIHTYFEHLTLLAPHALFIQIATPVGQYLGLIILSLIPLYVFRLLLGIFRGWSDKEDKSLTQTKSSPKKEPGMFKGADPEEVLPPPPEKTEEEPPKEANDNIPKEPTVSEKINIADIKTHP